MEEHRKYNIGLKQYSVSKSCDLLVELPKVKSIPDKIFTRSCLFIATNNKKEYNWKRQEFIFQLKISPLITRELLCIENYQHYCVSVYCSLEL